MPKPSLAALFLAACAALGAGACRRADGADAVPPIAERGPAPASDGRHLFTRLPARYTGVTFANRMEDTPEQNVFTYRNQYNGGGVAVGDLNGDGLPDLVLTGNQNGTHLYLNGGRFRFRDVTRAAGVGGNGAWTTGVTMADVDGDGRLDVYVCHSGLDATRRRNELWMNQGSGADGVPRFTDRAAEYGVADGGYGTQALFLDYDRDGRLDLLVVRNSPKPVTSFGTRNTRHVRDALGGARLYRNEGAPGAPRFTDVSARAGIYGPENAFGLGVASGDVNRDGWPDLYVSHDYYERDYLYLNRGDGTFAEVQDRAMPVGSYFSMGLDVADLDNDGWPDIYTTDMLPAGQRRLALTTSFEGWDVDRAKVRTGYGHQYMRNMLQRNNGDWGATSDTVRTGTFSDVGQMAGAARTDWSWGALAVDLDLDGRKDLFVTNGVARDVTSQDYVAFLADQTTMQEVTAGGKVDFMRLVRAMDSTPLPNAALRNLGPADSTPGAPPRFEDAAAAWGLDQPSFSNGAAYGDLDGDGAPDLVVNNVNGEAFVYRNDARTRLPNNTFVQVRLDGAGGNRYGLGARVTLRAGRGSTAEQWVQEQAPTRGFESSVDPVLTFGVGARAVVDSLTVEWPDGRVSTLRSIATNQRLTVRQADAAPGRVLPARTAPDPLPGGAPPLFADATGAAAIPFAHRENDFVDFDRERLIPKLVSTEGPAMAVGDVNGDGLDDLYLGGAKDQPGQLLVQQRDGRFVASNPGLFERDAISEDVGAMFFDADRDGRPDLYVVSGGSDFGQDAPALQDRLYLNDGGGRFHKAEGALPVETTAGSRPAVADVDGDGDLDVFVGGRVVPFAYGVSPQSTLLVNDGRGHFVDATARLAPALQRVGMVTDAAFTDVDGDGRPDLVAVGDWMPVTVFRNAGGGRLTPAAVPGLAGSEGWWNRVVVADVTGDGRSDLVLGNLGLNSRLHASADEPTRLYVKDFDRNGITEQILTCFNEGKDYVVPLRDDLIKALPSLKARYLKYSSFAGQTFADVFPAQDLEGAVVRTARTFASAVAVADGRGGFALRPLPAEAQEAPVFGILAGDVDGDGRADLVLAGNFDGVKPEIGRLAAGYGLVLRGDGRGHFAPVPPVASGFRAPGETRDLARLRTAAGPLVVAARNNDRSLAFRPALRPNALAAR